MADFCFVALWELEAPIEEVWASLADFAQWPGWWPAVRSVTELQPAGLQGTGGVHRFLWQTPLGYPLKFDATLTQIEAPRRIVLRAVGEVEGSGCWELSSTSQGTQLLYFWTVRTTKPWMTQLARVFKPLMEWSHDAVMRQGGRALAQHLGVTLLRNEALPPDSAAPTAA